MILTYWKRFMLSLVGPMYIDSPDPPAPDPAIGQAAAQNAEVAREALAFNKQQYEESKPRTAAYDALVKQIVDTQLSGMEKSQGLADEYAEYLRTTFRPLETGIVQDAANYDTPARREEAAGEAAGDVRTQFGLQRDMAGRNLTRSGVDPSSGRYADMELGLGIAEAGTAAAAANKARKDIEAQGFARKMDAASLGRNLPSSQATSQQIALSAGSSAAGNAAAPLGQYRADAGLMNSGYGTAIQGNQSAGNLLLGQYQGQLSAYNAAQQADAGLWGGLGSAAGMVLGASSKPWIFSDEKVKTGKTAVDGELILDGLRTLPVEAWKYKEGVADGGKHIGPYAQDVRETFGDTVAPGGQQIDLVSMNGLALVGIKELAKKVDRIEKNRGLVPAMVGRESRNTEPRFAHRMLTIMHDGLKPITEQRV